MDGPWGPWRIHEGEAGSMEFNEFLVWFMGSIKLMVFPSRSCWLHEGHVGSMKEGHVGSMRIIEGS